jgi:hypothetical protein|tara:strand:- start:479 stop:721 length:243 start_codon:yes stop_codon:yes gene_type:complete
MAGFKVGMKTIIHVNQHIIKANRKNGENNPPLTVKTYKSGFNCHEVEFTNGRVIHRPDRPLSCGAHVWIETDEPVRVIED